MINILHPKQLTDFYQYANHIIYAVVIAQSYLIANEILIPIQNIQTYSGFLGAYGLIFAYFVIVSGWIGYFKSIKRNPHRGKIGNARFVIDLWIVFTTFYLLALTDPSNRNSYGDSFLLVLPTLFGSYFIWDLFKFFEYRTDNDSDKSYMKSRMKTTLVFLIIFCVQAWLYFHVYDNVTDLKWDGIVAWDPIFITTSFASVLVYRLVKWKTGYRQRRNTKKLTKKETESDDIS